MTRKYRLNENIDFQVTRSDRKSLSIVIKRGVVDVKAPHRMSEAAVLDFVSAKRDWIIKNYRKPREFCLDVFQKELVLFARTCTVRHEPSSAVSFRLIGDVLWVYHPAKTSAAALNRALKTYVEGLLSDHIQAKVNQTCMTFNVRYHQIALKNYTASWGKCTSKQDLYFARKLVFCSLDFIDYVVIHECAHLRFFDHSKAFYALISTLMPNYKQIIKENARIMNDLA